VILVFPRFVGGGWARGNNSEGGKSSSAGGGFTEFFPAPLTEKRKTSRDRRGQGAVSIGDASLTARRKGVENLASPKRAWREEEVVGWEGGFTSITEAVNRLRSKKKSIVIEGILSSGKEGRSFCRWQRASRRRRGVLFRGRFEEGRLRREEEARFRKGKGRLARASRPY